MKKKLKWIILGCIAGVILLGIIGVNLLKGQAATLVYTTQAVYADIEDVLDISGTVESESKVTYYTPATGVISEVFVQAGDTVKSGEMLIAYDQEELQNRLTLEELQAKANESGYQASKNGDKEATVKYNEAVNALATLEQQITNEKNNLNTLNQALTDKQNKYSNDVLKTTYDLSNQQASLEAELKELAATVGKDADEYKEKELELSKLLQTISAYEYSKKLIVTDEETKNLQNKINAATENLQKLEAEKLKMESQKATSEAAMIDSETKKQNSANYELAELNYEQTIKEIEAAQAGIVAEFDGVVSAVTVEEGATVTAGMQMVTINSNQDVKVTISLTKYALEKVSVGQKAEITILDKTYQGTVSRISKLAVQGTNGTASVAAEIHIENPDDSIILGIEAKVKILTDSVKGALTIPLTAVNADKEGDFVYVVTEGVVQKKYIITGISSGEVIEVKEGLTEEDCIVTNVYSNLEEGMPVMAIPEE